MIAIMIGMSALRVGARETIGLDLEDILDQKIITACRLPIAIEHALRNWALVDNRKEHWMRTAENLPKLKLPGSRFS